MKKSYSAIVLCLVLCFFTACNFVQKNEENFTEFTPEKWEKYQWERKEMIDDLTSDYDLYSMNYDDIIKLLGTTGIEKSLCVENERISYYAGKTHMDPFLFSIHFGDNGYVESYILHTG